MTARRLLGPSLSLILFTYGCGSGDPMPKTYPAKGRVTYQGGKAFASGSIRFVHGTDTTFSVTGDIDNEGNFELYTIKGAKKVGGAPEGEYKVTIYPPIAQDQKTLPPIELPNVLRVDEKENHFPIELPASVKAPR